MSRILVCKDNEDLVLKKRNALQYKEIDFSSLACGSTFTIEDADDKLIGVSTEPDDEEPTYTLVTNEFGLYALSSGIKAKVKVSFCDNGMMAVDLLEGAVIIKPEDDVLLVSKGVSELPSIDLNNILWVSADRLLAYSKYWKGLQSKYTQDFEYVFVLSGEYKNDLESFTIKSVQDEVIDISGGHIAVLEAQQKTKEEAKAVKKGFNNFMSQVASSSASGYAFEDDDTDDDDEDDEDEEFDY